MNHEMFEDTILNLIQKGYILVEKREAVINGVNNAVPPMLIVQCPPYKKIDTTPRMWCHLHGKESSNKEKRTYCYSCKFSFSSDHPQDEESIEKIILKRYEMLKGWVNQLPDLTKKKKDND